MSRSFLPRVLPLLALAIALVPALGGLARADGLTVFAAASLKNVLDEVAAGWPGANGGRIVLSYAGSSALARQIAAGAPADLFVSANSGWMDWLEGEGHVRSETRRNIAGNRLVLIAHGSGAPLLDLGETGALVRRLGEGRLAMALVEAAPAGIYGKQALESLGLWQAVSDRIAQVDNVRAALALVARGETPLGIVYATDAKAEPDVSVVARFAPSAHSPIVYTAAVTAQSRSDSAHDFLEYLSSPGAGAAFERHGFAATGPGG